MAKGDIKAAYLAGLAARATRVLTAADGSQLPTADPQVAGKLWADNGAVKVSAGA